jgi:hypothetical protein
VSLRARSDSGALAYGGIAITRRYEQGRGANEVLGPDVAWQINDAWRMRGQWLHSRSTALPQANGELQRCAAVTGERLRLRAVRQSGAGESALGIDDIGTGFRHDTGFVNQAGVRKLEAFQSIGWQGLGPFNDFYINAEAEQVRDRLTGQLVQEVLRPGIWFTGSSNLEASLRYYGHVRTRTAATAPLLKERYVSGSLTITPATWFPLLETSADLGAWRTQPLALR